MTATSLGAVPGQEYGPPLIQYARSLWKRKLLVAVVVAGMTVPAVALSSAQPPVYSATAELVLGQQRLDSDFNIEATDLSDRQIATQMRVITSTAVTELALAHGATGSVKVFTPSLSNVLSLTADGPTSAAAALTANAYAEAYIEHRTLQARATLDEAAEQLQQRITLLQQEIDPLAEQVRQSPPQERAAVQATIQPLQSGLQAQQATLQAQLGQIQVQRTLAASGASLVQRAEPPLQPVSPKPLRDGALAAVLGVALAVSMVVLIETARMGAGAPTLPGVSGRRRSRPRVRAWFDRFSEWLTPDGIAGRGGVHYHRNRRHAPPNPLSALDDDAPPRPRSAQEEHAPPIPRSAKNAAERAPARRS